MAKCKSCSSSWKSIFTLTLLICIPALSFATVENTRQLVLLNWADYMDPELISKFEKEYHVHVHTPYYESDDERTELLVQSAGKNYDLAIVDTPSITTYKKAGWLEPLDESKIPNLKYLSARWRNIQPDIASYSVPFSWGTLGIAYRSDLVEKKPSSWMDLYRPDSALQGKIAMYRNTVDLVGAANKALGFSLNSTNTDELNQVKDLILKQRPYVRTYDYLSLDGTSALITGEVIATMFYSSDTVYLQEEDENIAYIVPEEGTALWVDHLVVFKSSRNKDLAWQFINFLNQPEHAAQLAQYIYGPTPNTAAEKLLPEEFKQNPVIYPTPEILEKSEFNLPLPARIVRQRNDIITQLPKFLNNATQ